MDFKAKLQEKFAERQQARAEAVEEERRQDAQLVCPHCQTRGSVRKVGLQKVKKGISGGKAAAAVLTGGVSVLATGLSKKEGHTKMVCGNCGVGWLA